MLIIGAGSYGLWHWWQRQPSPQAEHTTSDSLILHHAEGRIRELVRREIQTDSLHSSTVTGPMKQLLQRLVPSPNAASFPIEVFVVDSPTVNAVSLPGGLIVIYTGLIQRMQSPEQLEAVLAHEVAHATHQDPMHALEREMGIAALLTIAGGRSDAVTMRLIRRLISSGYSRKQEADADKEAIRLLTTTDIDPAALAESLRRIRKEGSPDNSLLQYLSTHPDIDERIKLVEGAAVAWKGRARAIDLDWQQFAAQFKRPL